MTQEHKNFINGEWVAGTAYTPNINPSNTADVQGHYTQASAAQLDDAVQAARAAFGAWSVSGIQARADALDKIGSEILARREELGTLKIGDALEAGIDIGPVASQAQLEQDLGYVGIAQSEGATLACGGERLARATEGFYMQPALLTDTTSAMRINREEVFGPVASILRVKDYDAALAEANHTPFGLSAGIATSSLQHATHFKRQAQAGMVMVNLPTAGVDYHVPFGGRKGSSYGPREQGRYAQEFFTTVKTAYTGM